MKNCPESKRLEYLLGQASEFDNSETDALWLHLEKCGRCRAELDHLSDDLELSRWRDTKADETIQADEADALAQLVERLTDYDTPVDSNSNKQTNDRKDVDLRILQSFEPIEGSEDLGLLGQFRVRRMLGHGGMAVVFEAVDLELNRVVALKILRTDQTEPLSRERFIRESRALAGLKHPNVVSIYSAIPSQTSNPLIVMELVDGGSLQDRLRDKQTIHPKQAATWIAEVANGLAAAHEEGLIHRDIKPSNILLAKKEGAFVAKLADFGLARFSKTDQVATQTDVLLGTPAYMSPEYIAAPDSCNSKCDIYSLGVTLYELLTGEVPFRGAVHTVLQRIGRDDPLSPRSLNKLIPSDLETICMKAMHREPARRYTTAAEFGNDLERWKNGLPILARPASAKELSIAWVRRNPRIAALAGTIASLLLLLTIVSTYFAITIRAAGENLKKEKATVEATSKRLQTSVEDAKNQRQIAIDSLNQLVTKVQQELAQRPGTFALRQAILDVAIKGLDRVAIGSNSTDIDLTRVLAIIQKGQIYDSLGKSDISTAELTKACDLAESYNKMAPDRIDVQRVLCDALFAQADIATRRGGIDIAMSLYQRVKSMREADASLLLKDVEDANSFNVRRALFGVLERIGDLYGHRVEWDEAFQYHERALSIARTNALAFPESNQAKRDLSLGFQRMGTTEVYREHIEEATGYFLEAVEINRSLLASDPENKIYAGDQGYILGELSKLTNAKGDFDSAIAQAKEAILLCNRVVKLDPEDTDAEIKAALSWLFLFDILLDSNRLGLAEKAINKFLEQNAKIVERNPTASKFPMMSASWLITLSDVQFRQGKMSASLESVKKSIYYLKRCQKASDAPPEYFEPLIAIQEKTLVAAELVPTALNISEESVADPDVLFIARVVLMYERARTGDVGTAIELGKRLENRPAMNQLIIESGEMTMARAYSLSSKTMSRQDNTSQEFSDEDRALVVESAISHLKTLLDRPALKSNPSARRKLLRDHDLDPLREQESFQSLYP